MPSRLLGKHWERQLLQKHPKLLAHLAISSLHALLPGAALRGVQAGGGWAPDRRGPSRGGCPRGQWPARGELALGCMRGSGPAFRLCRRGAGGSSRAKSEHSQARMFWQPSLAAWAKLFITLCIFLLICVQPAPMAQLAFCLPEPSQSLGSARSWLSIHTFCLLQLLLEQRGITN